MLVTILLRLASGRWKISRFHPGMPEQSLLVTTPALYVASKLMPGISFRKADLFFRFTLQCHCFVCRKPLPLWIFCSNDVPAGADSSTFPFLKPRRLLPEKERKPGRHWAQNTRYASLNDAP